MALCCAALIAAWVRVDAAAAAAMDVEGSGPLTGTMAGGTGYFPIAPAGSCKPLSATRGPDTGPTKALLSGTLSPTG